MLGLWLDSAWPHHYRMARTTLTFTVSLPPEMGADLDRAMQEEHRTRSELVREALRRYFADRPRQQEIPGL
jgi:metal-responsive CopG/Arc/MetJ family transcriptional regulator